MIDYSKLGEVLDHNERQMNKVDGDQGSAENLITFVFEEEEVEIWNPFLDSSCRFEVDPVTEYGEKNIQEMINKFNKLNA